MLRCYCDNLRCCAQDVAAELQIKALVGGRATPTFHVFELTFSLPRFAMYVPVDAAKAEQAQAGVRFVVGDVGRRVRQWINSTFNMQARHDTTHTVSTMGARNHWVGHGQ